MLPKTSPGTLLPALVAHVFVPEPAGFYREARTQGLQWDIWTRTSCHEIPQISTTSCGGCLVVSDSSRIPWTPLSVGFSRQEYRSGLPFPSPGDLPDPGIEPTSPALASGFFTTEPPGKPTLPVQFSSVAQSCPTLCDPMNRSMPGLPVHHQLPEFTQTHVHQVGDAIQPSHPLSSPSLLAPNPSQHQSLFQ